MKNQNRKASALGSTRGSAAHGAQGCECQIGTWGLRRRQKRGGHRRQECGAKPPMWEGCCEMRSRSATRPEPLVQHLSEHQELMTAQAGTAAFPRRNTVLPKESPPFPRCPAPAATRTAPAKPGDSSTEHRAAVRTGTCWQQETPFDTNQSISRGATAEAPCKWALKTVAFRLTARRINPLCREELQPCCQCPSTAELPAVSESKPPAPLSDGARSPGLHTHHPCSAKPRLPQPR